MKIRDTYFAAFVLTGLAATAPAYAASGSEGAPVQVAQATTAQKPAARPATNAAAAPAQDQDPRAMGAHMEQMGKHMAEMGRAMERKGMQMRKSGSAMGMDMEKMGMGMESMDKDMDSMDKTMEGGHM